MESEIIIPFHGPLLVCKSILTPQSRPRRPLVYRDGLRSREQFSPPTDQSISRRLLDINERKLNQTGPPTR